MILNFHDSAATLALAAEIHQGNIAAGWWKQEAPTMNFGKPVTVPRNIGELLALVHSEISEADEGSIWGKMDDKLPHRLMVEVELADTAIRVLDILGYYETVGMIDDEVSLAPFADWSIWIRMMHRLTTKALEGFRKGDAQKGCGYLVNLLQIIQAAGKRFELDVGAAIVEKRAYNATRADHKPENRAAVGGKQF